MTILAEERLFSTVTGETYHWMNDAFPAHGISLRSASQENVVIIDQSRREKVKDNRGNGQVQRHDASSR